MLGAILFASFRSASSFGGMQVTAGERQYPGALFGRAHFSFLQKGTEGMPSAEARLASSARPTQRFLPHRVSAGGTVGDAQLLCAVVNLR